MEWIEKMNQISDVLTEKDMTEARAIWEDIKRMHPDGFTILSHLEKIPKPGTSDQFQFDIQFSKPVATFMEIIIKKYPNKDLNSAIIGRIIGEAINE